MLSRVLDRGSKRQGIRLIFREVLENLIDGGIVARRKEKIAIQSVPSIGLVVKRECSRRYYTKVLSSAPDTPEKIAVLRRRRIHDVALSSHYCDGLECIDDHTVQTLVRTNAAAKSRANHANT